MPLSGIISFLVLVFAIAFVHSLELSFRRGTSRDVALARKIILKEAMNPLSISQERLMVAYSDREEEDILGFGQIRPVDDTFSELASLYVMPSRRRQGVAGALIQKLLEIHDDVPEASSEVASKVCLLTLKPTAGLYEKYGFETIGEEEMKTQLPASVKFEFKAGSVVSAWLGNELICMLRKPSGR